MLFLKCHFLLAVLIKYLDLKVFNKIESSNRRLGKRHSHPVNEALLYGINLVLHLYPMSKLLNELNIMKLKLHFYIMPSGSFTLGLESEIF